MLDSNNDILNKTEDTRQDEACYGGFGKRLSYERWCRGEKGNLKLWIPRLTLVVSITLLFGMIGVLCGVTVFHLVRDNAEIYYANVQKSEKNQEADTARLFDGISKSPVSELVLMKNSVTAENISHEVAQRYRIPIGILIHKVIENSSAHAAGLLTGDIIVAVNGTAATDITSLDSMLAKYKLGTIVKFTVFREDTYVDLNVNLD